MTDIQRTESAAAAKEAAEHAGNPHTTRGSRAADIQGGLMRYLAAEAYHEKVLEDTEKSAPGEGPGKSAEKSAQKPAKPGTAR